MKAYILAGFAGFLGLTTFFAGLVLGVDFFFAATFFAGFFADVFLALTFFSAGVFSSTGAFVGYSVCDVVRKVRETSGRVATATIRGLSSDEAAAEVLSATRVSKRGSMVASGEEQVKPSPLSTKAFIYDYLYRRSSALISRVDPLMY